MARGLFKKATRIAKNLKSKLLELDFLNLKPKGAGKNIGIMCEDSKGRLSLFKSGSGNELREKNEAIAERVSCEILKKSLKDVKNAPMVPETSLIEVEDTIFVQSVFHPEFKAIGKRTRAEKIFDLPSEQEKVKTWYDELTQDQQNQARRSLIESIKMANHDPHTENLGMAYDPQYHQKKVAMIDLGLGLLNLNQKLDHDDLFPNRFTRFTGKDRFSPRQMAAYKVILEDQKFLGELDQETQRMMHSKTEQGTICKEVLEQVQKEVGEQKFGEFLKDWVKVPEGESKSLATASQWIISQQATRMEQACQIVQKHHRSQSKVKRPASERFADVKKRFSLRRHSLPENFSKVNSGLGF